MSSTSETGHAKNVAKFDELISSVTALGVSYNPSKSSIKLASLLTIATTARGTLAAVNQANSVLKSAEAAREVAFSPVNKITTRVGNAVKATDSSEAVDKNVREIIRKVQGVRVTPKKTEEEKQALAQKKGKVIKEISSSQQSYDSRLENLDKLIKLLQGIPQYNPNEPELKIAALTTLYTDLKAKNTAVVNASIALDNARIARNTVLYKDTSGMVDLAQDAKTYIKSVFDSSSPQYKQVSKIQFKRY